jgi:hypothetical protein
MRGLYGELGRNKDRLLIFADELTGQERFPALESLKSAKKCLSDFCFTYISLINRFLSFFRIAGMSAECRLLWHSLLFT